MERNDLIERLRELPEKAGLAGSYKGDCLAAANLIATQTATIERLAAEKEEAERDGWMPIETAPKDGSLIDLWARRETTGKFDRYTECQWGRRNFGSEPYGEPVWLGLQDQYSVITPTHWRPLPAPPRDLSQGGQHG